jgi:hypothetical protein
VRALTDRAWRVRGMTRSAPLVLTRIHFLALALALAPGRIPGRQTENKGLIGFVSQSASFLIAALGLLRQSGRNRIPYSAVYMKRALSERNLRMNPMHREHRSGEKRDPLAISQSLQQFPTLSDKFICAFSFRDGLPARCFRNKSNLG